MYIVIPIILITIIVGIAFGASNFKNVDFSSADLGIDLTSFLPFREERSAQGTPSSRTPQATLRQPGSVVLDTAITQGPPEGFILTNITTITFEFSAAATPQTTQPISFETKIEGFDTEWQPTLSATRTVTLPLETKQYMFFVRARLGTAVDPTPAQRSFSIAAY
jgi:hypothetical protein